MSITPAKGLQVTLSWSSSPVRHPVYLICALISFAGIVSGQEQFTLEFPEPGVMLEDPVFTRNRCTLENIPTAGALAAYIRGHNISGENTNDDTQDLQITLNGILWPNQGPIANFFTADVNPQVVFARAKGTYFKIETTPECIAPDNDPIFTRERCRALGLSTGADLKRIFREANRDHLPPWMRHALEHVRVMYGAVEWRDDHPIDPYFFDGTVSPVVAIIIAVERLTLLTPDGLNTMQRQVPGDERLRGPSLVAGLVSARAILEMNRLVDAQARGAAAPAAVRSDQTSEGDD